MAPGRSAALVCPHSLPRARSASLLALLIAAGSLFLATPLRAHADTVGSTTVAASTSVYATSTQTYGGTAQVLIPIAAGTTQITFSVTETNGPLTVSVNGGGNYNDPDGVGSASGEYNTGTSGPGDNLSGITTPSAGFMAGVFTDGTDSEIATPLDYTTTSSVSAGSFSPSLDQVFFIGDGLTGDGTGATQTFFIPAGTTELSLGLTDACGYSGSPSCYGDNIGSFTVNYDESGAVVTPPPASAVPEPSSLLLLGTGLLGCAGCAFRRVRSRLNS